MSATNTNPARIWVMAARPKTLPLGVAPVLVGTALAGYLHIFHPLRFIAALLGSVFIQIGANLSNDYSDAHRGADTEDRLGPVRVTAGGLVPPRQVLIATYVTFGLAVLCGVYLIAVAGWQLLLIGVASIIAGVLYTGGPRPYGYEGLGEVFVFLFFGIAAVAGSYFAQVRDFSWESLVLSAPIGLIAAAVLVVNNTRDIDTDRRANKRTLAVRIGRERSRRMYATMVLIAYPIVLIPWVFGPLTAWLLLPFLTVPIAAGVIKIVSTHSDGPSLNRALAKTGQLQLCFCVLLSAGLLLSR
jgi:1,4-dihydroxy-2-naphthoate octaprenyltransferase